ncbi:alkaline phosphatase family protein [Lysobacter solisilvae (ex Woo and Kim 2020)]|uniref:Alkaline phosphatase family protein n=1 Tax=Agrilutibacter terrestris TaxID=2865112 RepID=A0A7H0FVB9_9GAMM|nr:ectonucleotide pyrophosphatase/phosphodiesterase [Lysobacter terrestris]QNP39985.1 alkaline phosphatase family protein [Lysobacter terrestris]
MPLNRLPGLAALLALVLTACVSAPAVAPAAAPVLLVSIDSFRPDYLDRGLTPNLAGLAHDGVRAQWMNPSYPSLTFPNHYTLVTGLRPDHHGIVHNVMRDRALGDFTGSDEGAVREARWWGGEPLWVTAEKAGLRTATLFWPGSEAPIRGTWPSDWRKYDEDMPLAQRVDTVLDWLSRPAARQPRLTTLYISALDQAGHDFGPDAPQTNATLREVDAAIGRLLRGLDKRGLRARVNVVVVSDHGMAPVPAAQGFDIDTLVDSRDASYVTTGEVLGFVPKPGHEAAAEQQLLGRHAHHECWRKGELPARWHYGTNPRIPPIVCQVDTGWAALSATRLAKRPPGSTRGAHGFDPADPSMRALFIAQGPAFRDSVELAPFDNVDVYPLLAKLLGIAPQANDGDLAPLLPALK